MADTETVDVWNAASAAGRQLFTQGVSPNMLHAMQNISVTMGKTLCANMQHINSIVGRVGEEHGVVGHLPCTKTAMDLPTMPQHGCQLQENLPNGSCCCTDCMSHSVDLDERHQYLENAHFISLEVSSNVPGSPQLEITNSSLFHSPTSLEPPVLLADRRALRLKGSPDFGTAVVHMQAVNVTVLQQLLVPVQRKEWRQMQYVACALRSLRHLILDIVSAGSVSLGCIAETWTPYYAELNNYMHFSLSLGFN